MVAVFPWGRESPLVAFVVVAALIAYLVVAVLSYQLIKRILLQLEQAPPRVLSVFTPRTRHILRQSLFYALLVLSVYVVLYASTWFWAPLFDTVFVPALLRFPAVVLIGAIFLASAIALGGVRSLGRRARKSKGKLGLSGPVLGVAEVLLRYSIYVGAGVSITAITLEAVGVQAGIGVAVSTWFREQASALFLLIALVAIGWAGTRAVKAVAEDVRTSGEAATPGVVKAASTVVRAVLYVVLGIVGTITVLSAMGLGQIGGTVVVVLSSFIGLVVAMAATGSIGNMLSGAVLLAFHPYARGERVIVADELVGDIEDIGLMFTRIRTVGNELVSVPNNQILLRRITNLSRSGPHAIVVRMGIGYDVPVADVERLALAGAAATSEILDDPKPQCYARKFGNFAIEYELYAYTRDPRHLARRSELLARLQETFHAERVEILTPDVHILRHDGSAPARTEAITPRP